MASIGDSAVKLAKSPLGLIALFVLLCEAIAALVITNTDALSPSSETILVCFICVFPVLVVAMFWHLVVNHNVKLYAPSEFPNHGDFLEANRVSTSSALEKFKADILEEIDRAAKEGSPPLARGSVALQAERYITATEFLETNKLNASDIEELRKLADSAPEDAEKLIEEAEKSSEESQKNNALAKLVGKVTAGAVGVAGGASVVAAASEIARIIIRLL